MLGAQVNALPFDYHHPHSFLRFLFGLRKQKEKKSNQRERHRKRDSKREQSKSEKNETGVKIALGEADGLKSRNLFGRCLSRKRYFGSGKKLLYLYS